MDQKSGQENMVAVEREVSVMGTFSIIVYVK